MREETRPAFAVEEETPLSLLERLGSVADEDSWRRLTELYSPLVRRWLGRGGLPPSDADDLTQEILIVLVREVREFAHSGRKGAFRAWLRMVVSHRLQGYRRGKSTRPVQTGAEDLERMVDPVGEDAERWDREHDEHVLGRLLEMIRPEFSDAAWRAFHRQSVDGLSASEAAAELGVSANAVLIAKSRVLRRLKREAAGLID